MRSLNYTNVLFIRQYSKTYIVLNQLVMQILATNNKILSSILNNKRSDYKIILERKYK